MNRKKIKLYFLALSLFISAVLFIVDWPNCNEVKYFATVIMLTIGTVDAWLDYRREKSNKKLLDDLLRP